MLLLHSAVCVPGQPCIPLHAPQPRRPQGRSAGGQHLCAGLWGGGGSTPPKLPGQCSLQAAGPSGAKVAIAAAQGPAQGFASSMVGRDTLTLGLRSTERRWHKGIGARSSSSYPDLVRSTCWQCPTQKYLQDCGLRAASASGSCPW